MIKKITHIIVSVWLAMLLLLGGTSMEFFHTFTGHTDTVHTECKKKGDIVLEPKHHHCAFLDFSLTPFVNDIQLPVVTFTSTHYYTYHDAVLSAEVRSAKITIAPRGPPTV